MKTKPNDMQRMALMECLKANGWRHVSIGKAFKISGTMVSHILKFRYGRLKKRIEDQNGINPVLNDKKSVSVLLKIDLSDIAK